MSSRELLVLLEFADEESPFKKYARPPFGRDGDWDEVTKILAASHKEQALYRASRYVGTENEYTPTVFVAPPERLEHFRVGQAEIESVDQSMEMFQNAGWL